MVWDLTSKYAQRQNVKGNVIPNHKNVTIKYLGIVIDHKLKFDQLDKLNKWRKKMF